MRIKKKSLRMDRLLRETMNSILLTSGCRLVKCSSHSGSIQKNHFSQTLGHSISSPQFGRNNNKPGVRKIKSVLYLWLGDTGKIIQRPYFFICSVTCQMKDSTREVTGSIQVKHSLISHHLTIIVKTIDGVLA